MEAAAHSRPQLATRANGMTQARQVVSDYISLTKPRVQSLLLWTTVTSMLVAGDPSIGLITLTCLGGAMSAGGAGAINHYLDRDLDARMERTADRPVPSGRVSTVAALTFGIALGVGAFVLLAATVNLLAAVLSAAGLLGYVFVYTIWLKRRTPLNIVIGGAAGAVPPLVGWAAVTGSLNLTAWLLFAIVFMWTPAHFWALSLMIKDDYAAVGVPMLPVVRGEAATCDQILLYAVLLTLTSLLPVATGAFGAVYGVTAGLMGALFVWYAAALRRDLQKRNALRTYLYSLLYLAILFVVMAIDTAA